MSGALRLEKARVQNELVDAYLKGTKKESGPGPLVSAYLEEAAGNDSGSMADRGAGKYGWTAQQKWDEAVRLSNRGQRTGFFADVPKPKQDEEMARLKSTLFPKITARHLPEDVEHWIEMACRDYFEKWNDQRRKDDKEAMSEVSQIINRISLEIQDYEKEKGKLPPVHQVRDWADQLDLSEQHPRLIKLMQERGIK